ncbi:EAL and GGDEF domain-containing protein [Noviherbaspirillum denitrificans]|uniref:Diguanylate cyclase n=1 Tax=Noviherbaspirillum denitrificans TaxID=1968433 RepID=A0A254T9L9_9BURK|nr:GGDEF domain-containing phosphodiesterase [Noviherbaspirillum denitrificans]OWW19275.1 hypothetical protein AYR66_06945 [Noviherbaspirillum denitrificans]
MGARTTRAGDDENDLPRGGLRDLLSRIDGIVWEADPLTFTFTYVSPAAERILGYPAADWRVPGFWAAHVHPDDRERVVAFCVSQTEAGLNHDFEYRMIAADGRTVWLQDAVTVTVENGEPVGLGGVMTDITERKELAGALQEKHDALARESAYLKAVLQHMPQGISVFDETLRLRHWNEGMVEVLNFPPEVLTEGACFDDLVRIPAQRGEYGPGDPEAHVARFRTLALEFREHQFERPRPNGKVHLVCGRPMHVGGALAGFVTTYTDITSHKKIEKELRLSDTVFNHSTMGISVTDAARRIVKVNPAFCAITGYDEDEVVGKTHALLSSGLQDATFYAAMWREVDATGSWSGEIWNRRKSGELYAEHLSIKRILDEAGEVVNYIGIFSDISHYKIAQDRIEQLSFFDALTGLPNRALLRDRLQQAIYTAERRNSRIAVLLIDLDRLSHVNDSLGHRIGDLLLLRVKARWQPMIRASDTLSRHIGDEFAVIVEDIQDAQDAADMAERLLGALARPFDLEGHEVSASARIGISVFPSDGKVPDVLLKNADVALHHAKAAVGGRFQFFREEMNQAATERLLIESSLRQALARNEFRVFYQPQLDLASGRIKGMEALVRWRHPELGIVSPARFIPIAEETGQIIDIGKWVLREACRQAREWNADAGSALVVAVNVSAKQFEHGCFATQVRQVLEETGLPAHQLELEITESVIMDRPDHVVSVMKELRELGVRFSIDDFGTGYSSLSQLKRFPIDTLKIDQSFTRDIGLDEGGTAITRAVIALGHSLRLQVVAEGVETTEQQRFLAQHGCHGMQGYLFSRPVEPAAFGALLSMHVPSELPPEWQI